MKKLFISVMLLMSFGAVAQPINNIKVTNHFSPDSIYTYCGSLDGENLYASDLPATTTWIVGQDFDFAREVVCLDGELFLDYNREIENQSSGFGFQCVWSYALFGYFIEIHSLNADVHHILTTKVVRVKDDMPVDSAYQYIWFRLQDNRDLFPDNMSCHIPMTLSPALDSVYLAHPEYLHFQWSTGETTPSIEVTEEGTYSVTVFTDCDTITDKVTITYDGISESREEPWFSQFGSQVSLLEDGELEVYNALGQRLLGTREKEITIAPPGLYVLRFRSIEGVKKTAKVVIH